ncbi:RNA polymerase II transcription elongation factor domain containing protein [Lactarius tabidus]|jgi:hypothetical protein
MATASSSWMPAQGRHNVRIGSSLAKALKARKGQPPQRNKNLPERDFYSLRYNHKPASIDPAKTGTLEVNPGREVTAVRVERPTANSNEVVVFKGEEKPAKECDCVLIYDEATQTFTLEKLDSHVNLNFDGKAQPRSRPTSSPPAASTSTQTPQRSPARTAADELEAQLEGGIGGLDALDGDGDADADGEPDPSFPPARAEVEELEDGEEEEGEVPLARTVQLKTTIPRARPKAAPMPPPPQTQQPAQPAAKSRTAPTGKKSAPAGTKARTSAAHARAPTPNPPPQLPPKPPRAAKPPAASPTTSKRSGASSAAAAAERRHPDEEDFEIRGPIAPAPMASATKRGGGAASAPPPPPPAQPSFSLALPTASGPDPLAHLYNGASSTSSAAVAAAESDDEWDEILAQPDRQQAHQEPSITITIEDEADDGLDFLERELLGEDEPMADGDVDGDGDGDEDGDEDMEEMMLSMLEEVVPTPRPGGGSAGGGPISMNQFVGGGVAVEDEDDEYSSSEESEED